MINYDYYKGFQQLCDRNPKITRIPPKKELEEAGCSISGTFYLVEPSGRVVNPASVNPDVLEESIRGLFVGIGIVYETDGKDEFGDDPQINIDQDDPKECKYCQECRQKIPIDQFGKKPGRGGNRKDVCKACEERIKAKTIGDITGFNKHQESNNEQPNAKSIGGRELKDRIRETLTEEKKPRELNPIGDQPDRAEYITRERARELVVEAYQIGVRDGKANINIIEPTAADLLRA